MYKLKDLKVYINQDHEFILKISFECPEGETAIKEIALVPGTSLRDVHYLLSTVLTHIPTEYADQKLKSS